MQGSRWGMLLVLLLAETAGASAGARELTGSLEVRGPVSLHGAHDLNLGIAGLLFERDQLASRLPTSERFDASTPGARALLVAFPQTRIEAGPSDVFTLRSNQPRILEDVAVDAWSFDGSTLPDTHVRVLPEDADAGLKVHLASNRSLEMTPVLPTARQPVEAEPFLDHDSILGWSVHPRDGVGIARLVHQVAWGGRFAAFLEGGELRLADGRTWITGPVRNETSSAAPAGVGGVGQYEHRIVVVVGEDGAIAWPEDPVGWTLAASRLEGSLHGDVAWIDADSSLLADGEPVSVEEGLVHVRGQLRFLAALGDASEWQVAGTAHFLAVDAGPNLAAAATVAGAAGLAALLAALLAPWRVAAAVVVGRAGRLLHAEPLGNASRRRIVEALHGLQPARVAELQAATGLARGTIEYHLHVLKAHHVVQVQGGTPVRNRAFMLNSGSLAFAVTVPVQESGPGGVAGAETRSAEAVRADRALAVAHSHPMRRALYEAASRLGQADFAALQASDPALARLPQSSATHHLQALVAAGALAARRVGRRKVYSPAVDAEAARIEQYRRLLGQMDALHLVRKAHRGPLVAGRGHPDRARLRQLADLGLLVRSGDSYTAAPFVQRLEGL